MSSFGPHLLIHTKLYPSCPIQQNEIPSIPGNVQRSFVVLLFQHLISLQLSFLVKVSLMVSIIDEDNLSEEKVGEEGSDDNDNNEEVIPASSHASKRRISTTDIWNGNFYCTDVSQEHIGTKYLDLANQTFGGGGTLGWICKDKPYVRRLSGIKVTKKRCAFFNVCDCPFVIRELYSTQSQLALIEIGEIPHIDKRSGATLFVLVQMHPTG